MSLSACISGVRSIVRLLVKYFDASVASSLSLLDVVGGTGGSNGTVGVSLNWMWRTKIENFFLFLRLDCLLLGEISPILPNSCRYVPTCSEYSMEAYKKYGVVKGTVLTAWRLCRCNPLGNCLSSTLLSEGYF